MRKPSAERCTPNHVLLHIARQRNLGERLIGDHERPRRIELAFSAVAVVALVAISAGYYFKWLPGLSLSGCFV